MRASQRCSHGSPLQNRAVASGGDSTLAITKDEWLFDRTVKTKLAFTAQ